MLTLGFLPTANLKGFLQVPAVAAILICIASFSEPTYASGPEVLAVSASESINTYESIGRPNPIYKARDNVERTTKTIGGTGRTTKAIGGTGRTTKAIGGTGRTTKAIGGTGRATKAIGGTGRTAKAIGGTGRSLKADTASSANASLDLPLLRGRIDAWDPATRIVEVLGQRVLIDGSTEFTLGATIVLEGSVANDGSLIATYAWIDDESIYVDGSSEAVITGRVSSIDPLIGKLKIGNLVVDYTAALSSGFANPVVGSILVASGIRPNPSGEFIAMAAKAK